MYGLSFPNDILYFPLIDVNLAGIIALSKTINPFHSTELLHFLDKDMHWILPRDRFYLKNFIYEKEILNSDK